MHRAHYGLWRLCAIQIYILLTYLHTYLQKVSVAALGCVLCCFINTILSSVAVHCVLLIRPESKPSDPASKHSCKLSSPTPSRDLKSRQSSSSSTTGTPRQSVTSSRCHGNHRVVHVVTMALIVVMAMWSVSLVFSHPVCLSVCVSV